jgi:hypothetical protein
MMLTSITFFAAPEKFPNAAADILSAATTEE